MLFMKYELRRGLPNRSENLYILILKTLTSETLCVSFKEISGTLVLWKAGIHLLFTGIIPIF